MNRPQQINVVVFLGILLFIGGLVTLSGNLTPSHRMEDENQICKLQIELREDGFFKVMKEEVRSRIEMKRLVPAYCVQKVILAKVLRSSMVLWSLYAILLASLFTFVFYLVGIKFGFSLIESLLFAGIISIGEQSVLWWRVLQGEALGMMFLSMALLVMIAHNRKGGLYRQLLFIALIILSCVSKESFLLMIPGILLLQTWHHGGFRTFNIKKSIRHNWISITTLSIFLVGIIAMLKYGYKRTSFHYTGWDGFNKEQFINIIKEYWSITMPFFAIAILVLFVILALSKKYKARIIKKETLFRIGLALSFYFVVTIPQHLLYMKSGYYNINETAHYTRYLSPGIISYAFLLTFLIYLLRKLKIDKKYYWFALVLSMIFLFIKTFFAWQEAKEFATYSKNNDNFFRTIANNTKAEDTILLVHVNANQPGGGYDLQAALRVWYILSEGFNRKNMVFYYYPKNYTLASQRGKAVQADTRRHSMKMVAFEEHNKPEEYAAVVVLDWPKEGLKITGIEGPVKASDYLSQNFVNSEKWFKRENFNRVKFRNGHVAWFKK